jgi:hypothetical protein
VWWHLVARLGAAQRMARTGANFFWGGGQWVAVHRIYQRIGVAVAVMAGIGVVVAPQQALARGAWRRKKTN